MTSIKFLSPQVGSIEIVHISNKATCISYKIIQNINLGLAQRVYQLGVCLIYKIATLCSFNKWEEGKVAAKQAWNLFSKGNHRATRTFNSNFLIDYSSDAFIYSDEQLYQPRKIVELLKQNKPFAMDLLSRSKIYHTFFSPKIQFDEDIKHLVK